MINKLRKMLNSDRAVSPVIAVILMVAITVVLAATVYVWVSGFGSQSSSASKSMSLSSASTQTAAFEKNYTVTAATPGMKYSDFDLTINGAEYAMDAAAPAGDAEWNAWRGATILTADSVVSAGDIIEIDSAATLSGATLRLLDSNANSVMLTLVIG